MTAGQVLCKMHKAVNAQMRIMWKVRTKHCKESSMSKLRCFPRLAYVHATDIRTLIIGLCHYSFVKLHTREIVSARNPRVPSTRFWVMGSESLWQILGRTKFHDLCPGRLRSCRHKTRKVRPAYLERRQRSLQKLVQVQVAADVEESYWQRPFQD